MPKKKSAHSNSPKRKRVHSKLPKKQSDQPDMPEKQSDQPDMPEKQSDQPDMPEKQSDRPDMPEKQSDQTEYVFNEFAKYLNGEEGKTILEHVESISKVIYQSEIDRENSILQQASNMQAAFSFVTAGLFVIAEIVCDHKGSHTPYWVIILPFIIMTCFLLMCLINATKAQERFTKENGFPSIKETVCHTTKNIKQLKNEKTRLHMIIREYSDNYDSLNKVNEERIGYIKKSMKWFYWAVFSSFLSAVWMILTDIYLN